MATDRVEGDVDDEVGETASRRFDSRPLPPDRPGAEDVPSRADSREGVTVADEETLDRREIGEAPRPFAECLDVPLGEGQPTPREVLERFSPTDAGLPEMTEAEAAEYIDLNADQRPWLAFAKDRDPAVQRVLAAMDKGQGHALERHEGFADDERLQRRVTALEDPAQLDDEKRAAGIDGCKPGDKAHRCADTATAVQDPDAFATIFARAIEHPDIREVLEKPFDPRTNPPRVAVPIQDLIGPDGRRYCSGYRLAPVAGDVRTAMDCRDAWVESGANGREPDVPEPRAFPIDSFEGGKAEFFFRPTPTRDGYEINTIFVEPPERAMDT
jgi:hypothetical protein